MRPHRKQYFTAISFRYMNFINFRSLDGWSVIVFVLRAINVPPTEIVGARNHGATLTHTRIVMIHYFQIRYYFSFN